MRLHFDNDLKIADPVMFIASERDWQRQICDDLEGLADSLGGRVDLGMCCRLSRDLNISLPLYHKDEEALFRLMLEMAQEDASLSACIQQAISQHASMQSYVFELLDSIVDFGEVATPSNLDTVGYMLRYCFDGIRHHLQWEDAAILRDLVKISSAIDTEQLRKDLLRNRTCEPQVQVNN